MQCLFMRGVHSKAAVISKSHFLNHSEGFCRERSMEELQSMAFLNLKPLLIKFYFQEWFKQITEY